MISCSLATCAENIVVDRFTDTVSLINLREQVIAEGFPLVIPKFCAYFQIRRGASDPQSLIGQFVLTIEGSDLMRGPYKVDFQDKLTHRAVIVVQNLVVPFPGSLRAAFHVEGSEIGSWAVACDLRPQQFQFGQREPEAITPVGTSFLPAASRKQPAARRTTAPKKH